jgi:limonene-1,2-epoxide hydrolase
VPASAGLLGLAAPTVEVRELTADTLQDAWPEIATVGTPGLRHWDLLAAERLLEGRCAGSPQGSQGRGVSGSCKGAPMEPSGVVEALWDRIQARDWSGVANLVAEDVVVEWPVSAERIVGNKNFVAVNSEYPGGWSIRVLRIVADGSEVVSEVEVPHDEFGVFRVASFWTVQQGRIVRGREYWTSVGADPRPEWRAALVEPM